MGWKNIYKRRLRVFAVSMLIYMDYKAVQRRSQWFSRGKEDALWENTHERNARRFLHMILELEGLWVKLGQYLSTRADVLPAAYICILKQLQDSLPPRPLEEVCQTIQHGLGKSVDELFTNFCVDPLATASIAQVHRATLKDGKEVVVKVQHEGIKEVILEDLKNAKTIVEWIAWAEPQYDFSPMIDEWCREAPKELDFNNEAENTRKVSENLRCKNDNYASNHANGVDVLIPQVVQSAEKVLVLQYMDGIRLNDNETLEAYGVDKKKLVEEITRAYAHQIYVDGFFNGDPHAGNFLVSKERPHHPILLDFGLTKSLSSSMKQALAKMFLACAEGNHVALLSAFAEMGLRLRLDMPDQVMEVSTLFFHRSTLANEASENVKSLSEQREKNMKVLQEKMDLNHKEVKRFNPFVALPGDAIIFMRVLNLLRGLSSSMNVRIVYLDIMRPFAEATLRNLINAPKMNTQWICNTPVHSYIEEKLRQLLVQMGNDKVLGLQVCAYKGGKVIIDTAAGMLGSYDPRPVQPDSLFPVFSATKGITAAVVHWLVDKGKLKLDETIANIWPEFGANGKDLIKVHHVLNHTSGLQNAMADVINTNPLMLCDWDQSLQQIAACSPETEPGSQQLYHYLSFGWLCGGIIEHASGKKFKEVLDEAIVHPLNIEGELYIGIPPGVEFRLATLALDKVDLEKLPVIQSRPEAPSSLRRSKLSKIASNLPIFFSSLNVSRATIPAANGYCSARALARYYATLAAGGKIPPPHSALSDPPLGAHPHVPKFPSLKPKRKNRMCNIKRPVLNYSLFTHNNDSSGYEALVNSINVEDAAPQRMMFSNPNIHEAFMGLGDYSGMVIPHGKFGLGFRRLQSSGGGKMMSFGHSGVGGSTGFCNVEHDFAIAVTVNKMSLGGVTRSIVQLVCREMNIPLPDEFSTHGVMGLDMQLNLHKL